MIPAVAEAFALVAKYWDVVELVIDAVENKGVTGDQLVAVIKQAIKAASDTAMAAELK